MSLLFVPLSADQLRRWATTGALDASLPAHTVNAGLQAAFEVADAEDAERVALLVASIAGLAATGRRLVVVAEGVPLPRPDGEADFGEVSTGEVGYGAVGAIFADEPGHDEVARAAAAIAGLRLDQAWDHPEVVALLSSADLLWHGAGEWESLVAG